jgi:hypothetical protein
MLRYCPRTQLHARDTDLKLAPLVETARGLTTVDLPIVTPRVLGRFSSPKGSRFVRYTDWDVKS